MNQPLTPIESQHIPWNAFPDPGLENNLNGWCLGESDYPHGPTPVSSLGVFPNSCSLNPHLLNVSFNRDAIAPLNGWASLKLSKSDSNAQGSLLFSPELSIPESKRNKNLSLEFSYKSSGAFVYGASSDVRMWIVAYNTIGVDDQLIHLPYNTLDGSGHFQTQFTTNKAYVRVMWYVATTNADSWDFWVDDLLLTDLQAQFIPFVSDWQSYTPNPSVNQGFGTISASALNWSQEGQYLYVWGNFTLGTPTTSEARLALPNGLIIDNGGTNYQFVHGVWGRGSVGVSHGGFILGQDGQNYIKFTHTAVFGDGSVNPSSSTIGQSVAGSGETIYVNFKVPIVGWTSGVKTQGQMLQNLPVNVSAYKSGGSVTSGSNVTGFTEALKDNTGSFNLSSGVFTNKYFGTYAVAWQSGDNNATFHLYNIVHLDQNDNVVMTYAGQGSASGQNISSAIIVDLPVGHKIAIRPTASASLNGGTTNKLQITKINTPNTLLAINRSTTKYLASNLTSTTNDIASLRMTNLIVGKRYQVEVHGSNSVLATNSSSDLRGFHDGVAIVRSYFGGTGVSANTFSIYSALSPVFTATTNTITFNWIGTGTAQLNGSGDNLHTYVTLTELNNTVEGNF